METLASKLEGVLGVARNSGNWLSEVAGFLRGQAAVQTSLVLRRCGVDKGVTNHVSAFAERPQESEVVLCSAIRGTIDFHEKEFGVMMSDVMR